jgi:hypothetical protein
VPEKFMTNSKNLISKKNLVLLAGKIAVNFSSEFLIGKQFEKFVEIAEVRQFCRNS